MLGAENVIFYGFIFCAVRKFLEDSSELVSFFSVYPYWEKLPYPGSHLFYRSSLNPIIVGKIKDHSFLPAQVN